MLHPYVQKRKILFFFHNKIENVLIHNGFTRYAYFYFPEIFRLWKRMDVRVRYRRNNWRTSSASSSLVARCRRCCRRIRSGDFIGSLHINRNIWRRRSRIGNSAYPAMYTLRPIFKTLEETPVSTCMYRMARISDKFHTDCSAQSSTMSTERPSDAELQQFDVTPCSCFINFFVTNYQLCFTGRYWRFREKMDQHKFAIAATPNRYIKFQAWFTNTSSYRPGHDGNIMSLVYLSLLHHENGLFGY